MDRHNRDNWCQAPGARRKELGSILNPLAEQFFEDTRKKCKGTKTGASHHWRSFYLYIKSLIGIPKRLKLGPGHRHTKMAEKEPFSAVYLHVVSRT